MRPRIQSWYLKRKDLFHFIGWFYAANAVLFTLLGYNYLHATLASGTLFSNNIVSYSSWAGKCFVIFFTLYNYLSYMALLAVIPACISLLFAALIPRINLIRFISILLAFINSALLLLDTRIFSMFHFHLNGTMLKMIANPAFSATFDLSQKEELIIACSLCLLLTIQCVIAAFSYKWLNFPSKLRCGSKLAGIWLIGLIFSYYALMLSMGGGNNLFIQQTPNYPLYNDIMAHFIPDKKARYTLMRYSEQLLAQPVFANYPLRYPLHPMNCEKQARAPNIIMIMVDALRADALSAEVMPNTYQFASKSWTFHNHLSGGNSTQAGLFSLFYSIPSSYWTASIEQKKTPIFFDLLRSNGYKLKVLWSSHMTLPPAYKNIYLGIKDILIHGAPGDNTMAHEQFITNQAIHFLEQTHSKPFFINLLYDSAHAWCLDNPMPIYFKPSLNPCNRIAINGDSERLPIFNRYQNAAHFVDTELKKLLDSIEKNGYLDNSIIIITADHGEEFNDTHQNYWGHASNFTDAQIKVPLIIHWPKNKPQQIHYKTTSYDIVPTLLQRAYHCKNPTQDYSIGQDLLKPRGRLPFLIAGSYIHTGLITEQEITTLEVSGRITMTDRQLNSLPQTKPNEKFIGQALDIMKRYFVPEKH